MRIYREINGFKIRGWLFRILLKGYSSDEFFLRDLKVYADGYIDCLGERKIEELKELLDSGRLCIKFPNKSTLFIPYIGYIRSIPLTEKYTNTEFVQIIEKTIRDLNDELAQTKADCLLSYKSYLIEPNEINYSRLEEIYHSIPISQRVLLETNENKDPLVELMTTKKIYNRKEREYFLNDYFEGDWINLK